MSDSKQTENTENTEAVFQTYTSSLPSQRIITEAGKIIQMTSGRYITKDEDEIEYLDSLIKSGFAYVKKGDPVTSEQADPMVALRAKIKAELAAEMQQEVPKVRDLGNTPKKPALNPASTATIESVTAASKSASK